MIKSFYYIALVWKLKDHVISLEYRSNIVSRRQQMEISWAVIPTVSSSSSEVKQEYKEKIPVMK